MASRSRLKRDVPSGPARSTRALSAKMWVCWGDWMPYRAVTPELFGVLKVRILSHPPLHGAAARSSLAGVSCKARQLQMRSRSLMARALDCRSSRCRFESGRLRQVSVVACSSNGEDGALSRRRYGFNSRAGCHICGACRGAGSANGLSIR